MPLVPLNIADIHSFSTTINNPFQTKTFLNATTNPSQSFYQPHTAANIHPSANLGSSSFVIAVNPIKFSSFFTQIHSVLFNAGNKSVKTIDGLDQHCTTEEYLRQIDAHMVFAMGEQLRDPSAYFQ